ncbi:WXG100 family type VII secretion target [Actinocrispum sp. NPDC049592]|uniref:WXG100 family type VII secretion target n=1 Tax=Actinocrispum sp. NPDC049592 TaxID=3154835 RepID=UPI00343C7E2E
MPAPELNAALKPVVDKDISSGPELQNAFGWFRDMLSARTGRYGEIYQSWRNHPAARGWTAQPWGAEDDRLFDELNGIEFGPLFADAQRFANLRGASEELRIGADGMRSRLHDAWSGPAGQAAVDAFDQLGKAAAVYRDTLNQFAAALDLARLTTREAIVSLQHSGLRRFELAGGVELRREQIRRIDQAMAGQQPFGRPLSPAELQRPNLVDLNAGNVEKWWSHEAINALDAMCDSYSSAIDGLRKLLSETSKAIADSWSTLDDALKKLHSGNLDPFAGVKAGEPAGTTPSGAPESVTIEDGQRRITTERDAQGRLSLTVDHPGAAQPLTAQPPPASVPSGGGGGGGGGRAGSGGGGGGGSGGGGGGGGSATSHQPAGPGSLVGAQQPAASQEPQQAGHAAAAAAGGAPPGGGSPMGGMPMGGMGAGQGGGDQERKPSRWRIQGDLLSDAAPEVVPMVIGDVDPYETKPKGRK